MTTDVPLKRRHPMIAFAAGVIAPGLGLWLTGRASVAIAVAIFAASLTLLIPALAVDGYLWFGPEFIPSALVVSRGGLILSSAFVGTWFALTDRPRTFAGWEHLWWAVGFGLVSFVGTMKLRTEVADRHIASMGYGCVVGGDAVAACPGVEGAGSQRIDRPLVRAVVVKRGFVPEDVVINDVVAVRPASSSWKGALPGFVRVIALAGSTVTVDENGRIGVDGFPVVAEPCPATIPHHGLPCTVEKQATSTGAKERVVVRTSFPRQFPITSVGPGQVFVLPDDRGHKLDAPAGLVSLADLDGRVVVAR